jgi:hypothetical protein
MDQNALDCLNCHNPVKPEEAKSFAGVFVCPSCFGIAEHVYSRGEAELRRMLLMYKETVRIALVKGELTLSSLEQKEPNKRDVMQAILQMGMTHGQLRSAADHVRGFVHHTQLSGQDQAEHQLVFRMESG